MKFIKYNVAKANSNSTIITSGSSGISAPSVNLSQYLKIEEAANYCLPLGGGTLTGELDINYNNGELKLYNNNGNSYIEGKSELNLKCSNINNLGALFIGDISSYTTSLYSDDSGFVIDSDTNWIDINCGSSINLNSDTYISGQLGVSSIRIGNIIISSSGNDLLIRNAYSGSTATIKASGDVIANS